ncbi:hypothetical protein [Candidatus Nitrotoga sp. 1052]|uniref:hypothetical protein n=1 Tax=Candidatus Nitrotoga sp. 1052 TaxID=2886964 RepID=UPI001EF6A557|nr:hypothetical protein [Candidatus Nitrotoga sp. 1052]CAH1076125.1 hypothetical protein NTG1052_290002 [Candidatus Nitrotoga sp. 1052]
MRHKPYSPGLWVARVTGQPNATRTLTCHKDARHLLEDIFGGVIPCHLLAPLVGGIKR